MDHVFTAVMLLGAIALMDERPSLGEGEKLARHESGRCHCGDKPLSYGKSSVVEYDCSPSRA